MQRGWWFHSASSTLLGQSEFDLLIDNRSLSKLSQGITTEITGEGASVAPQDQLTLTSLQPELDRYYLKVDWTTLGEYFRRLQDYRARARGGWGTVDYVLASD